MLYNFETALFISIYLQIGFYYNMCSDKTWYDTGLRLPQNLCCVGKLSDPSYKACGDFDKE